MKLIAALIATLFTVPVFAQTTQPFSATLYAGSPAVVVEVPGPVTPTQTITCSINTVNVRDYGLENLAAWPSVSASFGTFITTTQVSLGQAGPGLCSSTVIHPQYTVGALPAWDGTIDFSGASGTLTSFTKTGSAVNSIAHQLNGGPVRLQIHVPTNGPRFIGSSGAYAIGFGEQVTVTGTITFQ